MKHVRILVKVFPFWEPCVFAQNVSADKVGTICMAIGQLANEGIPVRVEGLFEKWLRQVSPEMTWDWAHLAYVRRFLAEIEAGSLKRLIINMPPQHGKSEQVTVRFAGYLLEQNPGLRIIVGAYNEQFATRFGRKTKRLLRGRVDLAQDQKAAQDWETTSGGSYLSVGVGSGATGRPADLLIIDDPLKNRLEAESIRHRETVWEWFTESLYTRLQPGAPVIIQMTRWHEDDLVGRLLSSGELAGDWVRVNLPALALPDDPLGRELGEALCPARFTVAALQDRRRLLGEYAFQALYQGEPSPREGSLFRVDRIVVLDGPRSRLLGRLDSLESTPAPGRGKEAEGALLDETLPPPRSSGTPSQGREKVWNGAELIGPPLPPAQGGKGANSDSEQQADLGLNLSPPHASGTPSLEGGRAESHSPNLIPVLSTQGGEGAEDQLPSPLLLGDSLLSRRESDGRTVLAWDLAATEDDGDWTAGVFMTRLPDGRLEVEPVRFRHEPYQRNERIRREAERLQPDVVRIPKDPGAAGKESVRTLALALSGFFVKSVAPTGSKVVRAEPFAAQVNAGNVVVVGPFAREYLEELRQFPLGKHDDWVDASADAFSEMIGDGWLDMSPADIRSALGLKGDQKQK